MSQLIRSADGELPRVRDVWLTIAVPFSKTMIDRFNPQHQVILDQPGPVQHPLAV